MRNDLRPHRTWLTLFALAVLLLLAGGPMAEWGLHLARDRGKNLAQERARVEEYARRFQDDMRLAERPEGQMKGDDIDRLLAPVDRLRVASNLERQAAAARLSHFTYNLASEKPANVSVIDSATMAESRLTMAADAPLDSDVDSFLHSLGHALPGRVRLLRVAVTRPAGDAPLSLANVHMEAEAEWLSNSAVRKTAGMP